MAWVRFPVRERCFWVAAAQPVGSQLWKKRQNDRTFLEHFQGALEQVREPPILRAPVKGLKAPAVISSACWFMCNNVCFKPSKTVISWILLPLLHHDGTRVCQSGIYLHLVYHICRR